MKVYKLKNGVTVPQVGFGTWQIKEGELAFNAVSTALEVGYRHIDTAAVYGNEVSVGKAINQSNLKREEIFVTSKLWNSDRGYEETLKAFEVSLKKLNLEYMDMYLLHWPANAKQFDNWRDINASSWKSLEKLYEEGKVKAIGVSNFMREHLEALLPTATIKPMVNQIEFHPGFMQEDTIALCEKESILIEAWSPLGSGKMLDNEVLIAIAKKYNVSVAQLCIRWVLQKGHLPLPKSVTPERIKNNLDVYGFIISDEDVNRIDALPYIGGSGLNPSEVEF
ncbi:aldo/keto reductase [Myroides guanonis]|uniref:Aldo/keto reductase n=1 Tax=Myroides guanonis TaxID=1150112 RepID=A0A1I3NQD7_9FLAO|nr:aldo/keto reductase [Myroides guanonis]SFJ11409.1 Aldo/keto reductase [Myroides guanonis]